MASKFVVAKFPVKRLYRRFWTRLRPGEYDANTARGASASAANASSGVEAEAAVTAADDEGFEHNESNAYGLAAAQWQWPDYYPQHSRSSNVTSREVNDDGENIMPRPGFHNYSPYERMPFLPRYMASHHQRRMESPATGGLLPPNFNFSSVLSRFSHSTSVAERGGRFRGGPPAPYPYGGPFSSLDGREGAGSMRPPRAIPPHMNWSRLQLLDQPRDDEFASRYPEGGNYPEVGDRSLSPSHRFPPPSNSLLLDPAPDRRPENDDDRAFGHHRIKSETDAVEAGQSPSGDFSGGGKFLLPDPTNAGLSEYPHDAERNLTSEGSTTLSQQETRYGERNNYSAMEHHHSMQPYGSGRRDDYTRHEFGSGGGDHDEYSASRDARFPHPDDYHDRYIGGGPTRNRGFGGRRGDNRSGRPYNMPPTRSGGRRQQREEE